MSLARARTKARALHRCISTIIGIQTKSQNDLVTKFSHYTVCTKSIYILLRQWPSAGASCFGHTGVTFVAENNRPGPGVLIIYVPPKSRPGGR